MAVSMMVFYCLVLGVLIFLDSVQRGYSESVFCRGISFFQPNCCPVSSGGQDPDISRTNEDFSSLYCVKGKDYYFYRYSSQESFICVSLGCGGRFTISPVASQATWSNWGRWSACSVTCGTGAQTRFRSCSTNRNFDCSQNENEGTLLRNCILTNCPPSNYYNTIYNAIYWRTWEQWGACSASCGGGTRTRIRFCSSGVSTDCSFSTHDDKQTLICNAHACNPNIGGSGVSISSNTNCGAVPPTYRVVGGKDAQNCQYPWMVLIYNVEKKTACGGSIIDPVHILTAAHCVVRKISNGSFYKTAPRNLKIFSGASKMPFIQHAKTIPGLVMRKALSVKTHEHYDNVKTNNDIAIITLTKPIEFNDCHLPICLPSVQEDSVGTSGCKVMGWGVRSNSKGEQVSPDLQYTDIHVVKPAYCSHYFRKYFNSGLKLCAYAYNRGSCLGDSGGPLTCPGPDGRYYQYGIVSSGAYRQCGNLPTMFTKVSNYVSWIGTNT